MYVASLFVYLNVCGFFCSLSGNNISGEGARAVAEGMKHFTSLQTL